jgi:hypothetical protein
MLTLVDNKPPPVELDPELQALLDDDPPRPKRSRRKSKKPKKKNPWPAIYARYPNLRPKPPTKIYVCEDNYVSGIADGCLFVLDGTRSFDEVMDGLARRIKLVAERDQLAQLALLPPEPRLVYSARVPVESVHKNSIRLAVVEPAHAS